MSTEDSTAGLCQCGCGEPAPIAKRTDAKFGWVKGQPKRFINRHAARVKRGPDYEIDPATGCWNWLKYIHKRYPRTTVDGSPAFAHRVYYERAKGSIPEDLQLDHLCRNTRCVNPEHLEPVTADENMRRRWQENGGAMAADEFVSLWNDPAVSVADIAARAGVTASSARGRASELRQKGHALMDRYGIAQLPNRR